MLKLNLVTPSKKLLTEFPVDEIMVPAYRGELNILPGHAALVSSLTTGILRFRKAGGGELESVAISWGYLEISQDTVTVLAETAEIGKELDLARAREAQQMALKKLGQPDISPEDMNKYMAKLERAIVRMEVASGVNPEGRGSMSH